MIRHPIYIHIYIYLDIVPDVPDTSGESKNNIQQCTSFKVNFPSRNKVYA